MATRDDASVRRVDDAVGPAYTHPVGAPATDPRPARGRARLRAAASAAVVLAILWTSHTLVDWSQVWAAVVDMTWLELLTLAIAAAWNTATYCS